MLYPEAGFTKGHVIDYYTRVSPVLLPHLRGRPLTLKRYPNGVEAGHFYEKQCPSHRPDWVERPRIGDINFCMANDLPTLVWLANLADLELHTSLALAEDYGTPTVIAFDLDPGPPATIVECAEVALELRMIFDAPRHAGVPEDVGLEGHAGLRAAQHADGLRRDAPVRARAGRAARAPAAGARGVGDEEVACAAARCSSTGARTRASRRP